MNIQFLRPKPLDISSLGEDFEEINRIGVYSNFGPYHEQFRAALGERFGVSNVSLCCNATVGLIASLKVLCPSGGEVITTPFTFIGTALAIVEAGYTPVFVDVESDTFNLDIGLVEAAITENTVAILPVHVFGNPCNPVEYEKLSERYGLKLLFDGAHAFGSDYMKRSLLSYGDATVVSFHATKIFHTLEGGGVFFKKEEYTKAFDSYINFGKLRDGRYSHVGLNGKMNEVSAAIGYRSLVDFDGVLNRRKSIESYYRSNLSSVSEISLQRKEGEINGAYFPILINGSVDVDMVVSKMLNKGVSCIRYFSYSIEKDYFNSDSVCIESKYISERVLCLPIYDGIEFEEVDFVCKSLVDILGEVML